MSMQPAALLWDVDGTLIDTTELIAESLDFIYKRYFGRSIPYEERRAIIGTPLKKQIRVFGELEEFGVDEAAITEDFIRHYEANRSRETILTDVTALLIEGKRHGFPTALVTSKNREELANTLPRLGIAESVDFAITADDVAHPKPDPEGLLSALQRFGIPPDDYAKAFYIGDTSHDMRAAWGAGVRGVAVTWGATPVPLLQAEHPAFLCDTPEQLRQILFGA